MTMKAYADLDEIRKGFIFEASCALDHLVAGISTGDVADEDGSIELSLAPRLMARIRELLAAEPEK